MFDFMKPVLSDKTIMKYNNKGLLIMNKISRAQLQPNSVDITLANTWKKLKPNVESVSEIYSDMLNRKIGLIDPRKKIEYDDGVFEQSLIDSHDYYILQPGEFVLMASKECLNIPNGILCFVQGRSSIARLGIQTEQAGLIDAGFKGTITFEVENQTDHQIILYEGMRVAQLYFFKAQKALRPYGCNSRASKYNGQIEATGSLIHKEIQYMD